MFGFGQGERQDAMLIACLGLVRIDWSGEREALLRVSLLEPTPVGGGVRRNAHLCGPFHVDGVLLNSDLHLLRVDARKRELKHKALRGLVQIGDGSLG